jgi:ubiquinone biosynthesis protein UbiJ
VASTNEYLVQQIQSNRSELARYFTSLRNSASHLADQYDTEKAINDQAEEVTWSAQDLGPLVHHILDLATRLMVLEDVPRVG